MAGFRKARAEQSAIKMGIYGPPGSGKTFSTLLFLEGLARLTSKRIAFVDTEHGTDFYAQAVQAREVHPEAFDFDALYTRSLTEVLREIKKLSPAEYCGVAIDSITHLWEAAILAYSGGRTRAGTIPMQAWGGIKKPYNDLMHFLLNSPLHVFILGRQGTEWADNEETGELVNVGYKMKAEGETAYEPHILVRMEAVKPRPNRKGGKPDSHALAVPTAFVEKDRSGLLSGKLIEWPSFNNMLAPLVGLLGGTQAQIQSEEESGFQDAESLRKQEADQARASVILRDQLMAKFWACKDLKEVDQVSRSITDGVKKDLLPADLKAVREAWSEAREKFKDMSQTEDTHD